MDPNSPGPRKQVNMKFSLGRRQLATIGLVVGAAIGGVGIANAATGTTTPTDPAVTTPVDPAAPAAGTGVDQSNSDPTHEATESADREAAETAGQGGFGGGNHHSNTDAAHEAAESPERVAQEAANDAALGATPTTTG